MASKISRELALLLTGKDVSWSKSTRGAEKSLQRLNTAGAKAGKNMSRNLQRGVVVAGAAAAGAAAFAVNAAMDFESSSASVAKTVDGNIQSILAANRALSKTTGLEVNTLNEISASAGALGIAKGDIDDFTKTVAILGVTTDDVPTDLGATSIGHLKTTLRLANKDYEHFGNTLVFLGNHGASTEGQILSMTENIAGAAATIGASTPQVLGWAAAVANTGEEAEAGGSSIQRFWLESFKSVSKGGAELKLMAKVSHQSVASFKKDFGKDASGTLAKFMVKLGKLSKAEQLATLENLGFTDIRITRALLKLLGNTDNLTDSLVDAEKGWKDNNAATTEAEKRFATTAAKIAILKANVNDAAITIGNELLPVLADLSTEAVGWITDHQSEIHSFGQDLGRGVREAVIWAKKLDWEAIGAGLSIAAGAGKGLVEAFTNAPPWLQGFLTTGFLANKFTGGAVMDVAGILLGSVVRGVLGMNAGVVNINAGVVNSGGLPGGGGAGGLGAGALAVGAGIPFALAGASALAAFSANEREFGGKGLSENEIRAIKWQRMSGDERHSSTLHGYGRQANQDALLASANRKLEQLKTVSSRGFSNAAHDNTRVAQASREAGRQAAQAIRDKDLSVNVGVNLATTVNVSTRQIGGGIVKQTIRSKTATGGGTRGIGGEIR